MTEEKFKIAKEEYLEKITQFMSLEGGLHPHFALICDKIEDPDSEVAAVVHIPIPGKLMNSSDSKDELVNEVVPQIAKEINQMFDVHGVMFVSEAWVRETKDKKEAEDWENIPIKKEVLIISISTEDKNETLMYDIIRSDSYVNENGELVQKVSLGEPQISESENFEGRFTGLYNRFKK